MIATEAPSLSVEKVLAIARTDGEPVYGYLSRFLLEMSLEDDGWHVDYYIKQPKDPKIRIAGGGPHYIIDPSDGRIIWKSYHQ